MNHGLGNFNMNAIGTSKNRATTIDPSLKFADKLAMKQKAAEQQLLENRLRKLGKDDEQMKKQIKHFQQQASYASDV